MGKIDWEQMRGSPATLGTKVVVEKTGNAVKSVAKAMFMPSFMMTVTTDEKWRLTEGEAAFFEAVRLTVSGAIVLLGKDPLNRPTLDSGHVLIAAATAFFLAGLVDMGGVILQGVGKNNQNKN